MLKFICISQCFHIKYNIIKYVIKNLLFVCLCVCVCDGFHLSNTVGRRVLFAALLLLLHCKIFILPFVLYICQVHGVLCSYNHCCQRE